MTYQAVFGHDANAIPGRITLQASTDDQAIKEVRAFVADGNRNGTWANVQLSDGRVYGASNKHGEAVGAYA